MVLNNSEDKFTTANQTANDLSGKGKLKLRDILLFTLIGVVILLLASNVYTLIQLKSYQNKAVDLEKKMEFLVGFANENFATQGEKLELLEQEVADLASRDK